MNLTLHLQIVGILMFGIVLLNFAVWKRFKWREEIQRLSLLTRQVFVVHSFYIMLSVGAFGIVSLFYPQALIDRTLLARLVLFFLTVFWASRLFMQLFVYDSSLWRGQRFNTFIHVTFTGIWAYFGAVYGYAFAQQWQS